MNSINVFGSKFFIVLAIVCSLAIFAGVQTQNMKEQVSSFAAEKTGDFLDPNFARKIINR